MAEVGANWRASSWAEVGANWLRLELIGGPAAGLRLELIGEIVIFGRALGGSGAALGGSGGAPGGPGRALGGSIYTKTPDQPPQRTLCYTQYQ